jgi:hypothetical protein
MAAPLAVPVGLPDAAAPQGLALPVDAFGTVLARALDQPPLTKARFAGIETGPDGLVVLFFELRPYPYVRSRLAYLASRCVALGELDPTGMGGGFVDGDPAMDAELAYLRSDAQPPCPYARPTGSIRSGGGRSCRHSCPPVAAGTPFGGPASPPFMPRARVGPPIGDLDVGQGPVCVEPLVFMNGGSQRPGRGGARGPRRALSPPSRKRHEWARYATALPAPARRDTRRPWPSVAPMR